MDVHIQFLNVEKEQFEDILIFFVKTKQNTKRNYKPIKFDNTIIY